MLAQLAQAVWESREIDVAYDRGDRVVERRLQPLGLVLKAGTWYLVAMVEGQMRTYRVARFRRAELTSDQFERPSEFDLACFWRESTAAYERDTARIEVTVRIDPAHLGWLVEVAGPAAVRAADVITRPDADPEGWTTLRVRMEWPTEVPPRLLALGAAAEVLDPPEIRTALADLARQALERYARSAAAEPGGAGGASHPPPVRARPG